MEKDKQKDFIKDGLTNADLIKKIKQIRKFIFEDDKNIVIKDDCEDKIKALEKIEEKFIERYPMLFEMIIQPHFEEERLNYLLNLRNNIINDKISQEKASIKVGKDLFDKYVNIKT